LHRRICVDADSIDAYASMQISGICIDAYASMQIFQDLHRRHRRWVSMQTLKHFSLRFGPKMKTSKVKQWRHFECATQLRVRSLWNTKYMVFEKIIVHSRATIKNKCMTNTTIQTVQPLFTFEFSKIFFLWAGFTVPLIRLSWTCNPAPNFETNVHSLDWTFGIAFDSHEPAWVRSAGERNEGRTKGLQRHVLWDD